MQQKPSTDKILIAGITILLLAISILTIVSLAEFKKADSPLYYLVIPVVLLLLIFIKLFIDRMREITARNEQLKSDAMFKGLLEAAPDAMIITDEDGQIILVNKQTEILFQYKQEELLGKKVELLIPHGSQSKHVEQRASYYDNPARRPMMHEGMESKGMKKNGEIFPAEISLSPFESESGLVITTTIRDITSRKRATEEIESLSMQINSSNDAIFTVDKDLKIRTWNVGAQNLYGYSGQEAIGKNPNELLHTHLSDAEINEAVKIIDSKGYWSSEFRRRTKAGKEIWVHSSNSAIKDDQNLLVGMVAVSFDITEQKALRKQVEHLASLVEQSSDAIISRGNDGRIISWNYGAEKLLGFKKEDTIGKNVREIGFLKLTSDEIKEIEKEIMTSDGWVSEKPFYHKNGTQIIASVTANLIKSETGQASSIVFVVKDISLIKEQEKMLRSSNVELEERIMERTREIISSEKRYRYLFENNPMPMWVMELDGFRFLDVNEIAVIRYGYSREEFLSMSVLDIRPEDERDIFLNSEHTFGQRASNYKKGTWTHIRKDGTTLKVEIYAHDILFEGKPARLILANDVTETKKAQEQLQASEKHFRSLIENSYDVISLMDESFRFIYRSPSAVRITGWTNEEVQESSRLAKKFIHPDDIAIVEAGMQESLANPGKIISAEFRNLHKNGNYLWMEGSLTNLLHDKNINGIVFNYRDITAEKEAKDKLIASEKRFRALIENHDDVVSMMDGSRNIIYRSPSAARVTGWSDEEMKNISGLTNVHPDDVNMMTDIFRQILENPGKSFKCLFRNKHKDGRYLWMEGIITNMLHEKNINAIVLNFRNVTERIEAQAKLIASEEHLRYTLDNMLEGVQIIGFDWRYIYVNDSMAKHGKYSKEDLIGHTVMEKYPGIEQQSIWSTYLECMNERVAIQLENEFEFPDGSVEWFELSFQPVPEGIFILSVDITDRKKAEVALVRNEEHYRQLVDQSVDGIFLADACGRYLDVNEAGRKMLGYTHGEIISKTIADVIDESEIPRIPVEVGRFSGGAIATSEWKFRRKDGSFFIGEVIGRNLDDGRLQGILRDVTERRRAEEALSKSEKLYRNLFENMLHGFSYCKAIFEEERLVDYEYLVVNSEYESQTGLKDLTGKKISEAVPGLLESNATFANAVSRVAVTGWPEKIESYIEQLDQWFSISLYSPEKGYFVCLLDNITERKEIELKIKRINMELEERVNRRTDELKRSNEELESFSYSVSHDLRAPLRAIIGFTALLEEDYSSKLDDEAKRITTIIKSNTLRMGNLIDDLLSFSRMGRHDLVRTNMSSNDVVKEVVEELLNKNSDDNIQWKINPLCAVNADANMLRQVWINLISNAMKYSRNSVEPLIEISSVTEMGETIFSVKDNGVGFDERYKHKLFKVFQRLHSTSEFEGTGVGLAIVHKIIDKHGGRVWAKAAPGEGACFYFSLPAEQAIK